MSKVIYGKLLAVPGSKSAIQWDQCAPCANYEQCKDVLTYDVPAGTNVRGIVLQGEEVKFYKQECIGAAKEYYTVAADGDKLNLAINNAYGYYEGAPLWSTAVFAEDVVTVCHIGQSETTSLVLEDGTIIEPATSEKLCKEVEYCEYKYISEEGATITIDGVEATEADYTYIDGTYTITTPKGSEVFINESPAPACKCGIIKWESADEEKK